MEDLAQSLLAYKAAAVTLWFALLFVAERLFPAAAARPERIAVAAAGLLANRPGVRRLARNLGLWAINVGVSLAIVVPVSGWAAGFSIGLRPAWWSGWTGLALDFVLLDFLIYWWHRANHVVPLLWRFHEVHHLDGFLDTTAALRFHFGEVILSALARAAVIVLLDIPLVSVLAFEAAILIAALFHHSNLRLPRGLERALARAIITPSIHWVHHHARRADTDSNYGTVFSFWDPVFGSRSASRRTPEMAIGVERRREQSLPRLIVSPFRPRPAPQA